LKHVTDEEFETAYNNQDNKNIINAVTKKYANKLSKDAQTSCGLHGLWRCIQSHDDSYGRKFTTSLFIHVDWECKREISYINRKKLGQLGDSDEDVISPVPSGEVSEILESLPDKEKEMMYQRFYENRTLEEIREGQGYSKEAARQNINKIISRLRENISEDFGV
jgi:DNA-directed RNA polymerase specialized sigma subunit